MPPLLRQWLLHALALVALLAVFGAYLQPDFMLNLANRLWLCA